jgi:tyrosinase
MARVVTSLEIDTAALDREFSRADVELHGVDHAGASYEGRLFLNLPDATVDTPYSDSHYAGSYFIFGHGGCLGDVGHCDVKPRRMYDPRRGHPLARARKVVDATVPIRRALEAGGALTVTVVPVIWSTTPHVGLPEDLVIYDEVRIVTYR